ncbi:MAG: hypothetical protein GKR89_26430 [Candidatus Latescibacteria bacterium]|nr:hypothetical protein [Candidatus Latescibacterota bacterium]
MAAEHTNPELTTRDVLSQIDRRLSLIEEDSRALDDKLTGRIDALDDKLTGRIDASDAKFNRRIDALDDKFDGRIDALDDKLSLKIDTGLGDLRKEMNSKFLWVLGVLVASWLSTIGTVLFK